MINKKIILIAFIGLMMFNYKSFAQKLEIGDHCPTLVLNNVLNWKSSELSFSDLKGKLIILDFWNPGCTACIEGFAELEVMQKKFQDRLQIILVNQQSRDSTLHFFSRLKRSIKMPTLPMITSDSILDVLFPHNAFPHDVWIDSNRMVRYIVTGYNTNVKNVEEFLNGNPPVLKEKKDIFNYNYDVPVIAEGNGRWIKEALYYSYIMHRIPAQVGGIIEPNHIYFNSASIVKLFKIAFSEGTKYNFNPRNTVILQVKNKSKYIYPENESDFDKWAENNAYYYELKVPDSMSSQLYEYMKQDLERYFDVRAFVSKRKVMCLVLVKKGSINKIKSKGGKTDSNIYSATGDTVCYFHNYALKNMMEELQALYQDKIAMPFIDGTGYNGNVDIKFNRKAVGDLSLLKKELLKNNLELVKKEWPTTVLVIRQNK